MKCYYTIDPKTGQSVLIPMCYGSLHESDKSKCHCPDPLTTYQFEKERFNQMIDEKNKTIESLEFELQNLRKILKIKQ